MSDKPAAPSQPIASGPQDEFDFMARKVTRCMFDVLTLMDGFREPTRSGGIIAIEELYFRITNGKHLDWEELKEESLNELAKEFEEAMAHGPVDPSASAREVAEKILDTSDDDIPTHIEPAEYRERWIAGVATLLESFSAAARAEARAEALEQAATVTIPYQDTNGLFLRGHMPTVWADKIRALLHSEKSGGALRKGRSGDENYIIPKENT